MLAFIACGTYETGYVYAVLALLLWVVYTRSVRGGLRASAPVLGGMAVAFCFHFASSRHGGTGNELSLDIPNVARVTVQQMAASIPFLGPWLQGQDCGTISKGDMLWPFVLGLLAVAALLFAVPREKVSGKSLGGLALLGLGLMLSANEVPRIAGTFGLDTTTRANIMSAVYTAQAAVNTTRTIVQAAR